jgi:hypothetical protein
MHMDKLARDYELLDAVCGVGHNAAGTCVSAGTRGVSGGFGCIVRNHGLAPDNLIFADTITADVRILAAGGRSSQEG